MYSIPSAGLVLAQVMDLTMAQKIAEMIGGIVP